MGPFINKEEMELSNSGKELEMLLKIGDIFPKIDYLLLKSEFELLSKQQQILLDYLGLEWKKEPAKPEEIKLIKKSNK